MPQPRSDENTAITLAGYADAVSMLDAASMETFLTVFRSMWEPRGEIAIQDVSRAWNSSVGF